MCDYSESEISALRGLFPGVKVYLCYFHSEQAWEQWVKDHKHGLSFEDADSLAEMLQECAWCPPAEDYEKLRFDHHFQLAVNRLKESDI